jgi:hypothetical protein
VVALEMTDIDAELEQFAMDAGCAPERVGKALVPDQATDLQRDARPPAAPSGFPTPEQSESSTVPANHGLGLDDGHGRRRLIHHAVTAHPTAEWVARQIVEAFPWDEAPGYLVRDHDAIYGEVVKRRLRGLGIRDRPIAPRSPQQNAYVERLIGSVRRECIDHVIVLGEAHLHRIMSAYASYYNQARTHLALGKDAPVGRSIERLGRIIAEPMVAGLHHRYSRI